MSKRMLVVLLLLFAVSAVPIALSQMEQAQPVYTFVSQFQVPRGSWAEYSSNTDKTFVPIAEKLVADGTLLSYSTFETIVHTPEGYTHGSAWSSTTIAGLMKVLDEVRKVGPQPGQLASTKHEDFLMTSTLHTAAAGGAAAYLRVICSQAKPDKAEDYTAALKKYLWPTFEDQVKKGVASYVAVDQQYVNNSAPSLRCVVITYPNADGMDKWATAVGGTLAKMSQADREAFFGSQVADSRRDFLARITHSAVHK
jgi:hypothetical protein